MRRAGTIALLLATTTACGAAADDATLDDGGELVDATHDQGTDALPGEDAHDAAARDAADTRAEDTPAEDTHVDASPPVDVDPDTIPWQTGATVGVGVARKDTGNWRGTNPFIAYAGYGVSLAAAEKWATALYRATLRDRGVRFVYAVQGPADSTYTGKEIGNSKIAASLLGEIGAATKFVLVAGHSSGSFVAHELLGQLEGGLDPAGVTKGRVVYFDLDGGTLYLSSAIVTRLRRAYFVGSKSAETGTASPNDSDMRSGAATYAAEGATYFQNVATSSGCNAGAIWCVHVTLVTTRPHDPAGASAELDYSDFAARPVAHGWLDAKASEAGLSP